MSKPKSGSNSAGKPKSEKHKKSRSGNKLTFKKLHVQHAEVGKSSLAVENQRLREELATMKLKFMDSSSSSNAVDGVESGSAMVPKPQGELGRSGKNGKKKGYNLQKAMGLSRKKYLYNRVRVSGRKLEFGHGYS
jgi:hypothetical protein